MAAKRKAKAEVTYDVEVLHARIWTPWSVGWERKDDAMRFSRACRGSVARVVRVERTVVAEVKP